MNQSVKVIATIFQSVLLSFFGAFVLGLLALPVTGQDTPETVINATDAPTTVVANVGRVLFHQLPDYSVSAPNGSGLTMNQITAYRNSLSTRITPRGETIKAILPQGLFYFAATRSIIGSPITT